MSRRQIRNRVRPKRSASRKRSGGSTLRQGRFVLSLPPNTRRRKRAARASYLLENWKLVAISRAFLLLLLGATTAAAQTSGLSANDAPTLQPGDVIRLVVWGRPEFSGDFSIGIDSALIHPLLKEVKVAGRPSEAVNRDIGSFLSKYFANPAFVATPLIHVLVTGEVKQAGVITVPPRTNVEQAIALVGGPTLLANLTDVKLVRHRRVSSLNLTDTTSVLVPTEVNSGDQIIVPPQPPQRRWVQDVLLPIGTVVTAVVGVVNLVVLLTRK